MPPAYSVSVAGRGRELERTFVEFGWAFLLSIVFMYIVLAAQYESLSLPLAIVLIVPIVLLAAITGVLLTSGDNNIFTQVGLVVLVGLATAKFIERSRTTATLRASAEPSVYERSGRLGSAARRRAPGRQPTRPAPRVRSRRLPLRRG